MRSLAWLSEFGLARSPPEHRELVPKRQILEQQQALGSAARNQGAEQNQYDIRHDEFRFGQGCQEINDSNGLRGFRYRQGLDPVDARQKGAEAAKKLHIPCAVIQAEPSRCNADGNAKEMVANLAGPLFALRVRGATHSDPEQPTDWLAELVCGKADPDRRAIFERYTIAVLKSVFFGDAAAMATLNSATNDAGVTILSTRAIKDFKP